MRKEIKDLKKNVSPLWAEAKSLEKEWQRGDPLYTDYDKLSEKVNFLIGKVTECLNSLPSPKNWMEQLEVNRQIFILCDLESQLPSLASRIETSVKLKSIFQEIDR